VFSIAEIRPPNPPSKATVCAMTKGNIAELAAIALSRYSLFCFRFEQSDTEENSVVAERVGFEPTVRLAWSITR